MSVNKSTPNYLFETSWEVCNKIGGLHTVIATKAFTLLEEFSDNYLLIGPEVLREEYGNPEFNEYFDLYADWKQQALKEGLKIRIGRWKINGSPIVILVDFSDKIKEKDEIFAQLWETYKLDSISGQWDYIEPAVFGYTAGRVIESFVKFNASKSDKIVAQFHDWHTGAGILYLKLNLPQVATIYSAHATVTGHFLALDNRKLYKNFENFNSDEIAKENNLVSKHSLEKISARESDIFVTAGEQMGQECARFLHRSIDLLIPNGFDDSFVPAKEAFEEKRKTAKEILRKTASVILNTEVNSDTFIIGTSGRYEFKSKGFDVFINMLGELNRNCNNLKKDVLAFVFVPARHYGPRKDIVNSEVPSGIAKGDEYLTHHLHEPELDPILNKIEQVQLLNKPENKVKIIYVPAFLNGNDGVFNLRYYDLLIGLDTTVFASYYESWGYPPLESLAFKIPTITTSLSGFGRWAKSQFDNNLNGMSIVERNDDNETEVTEQITNLICAQVAKSDQELLTDRNSAYEISRIALWNHLIGNYFEAFSLSLERAQERADFFVEIEDKQTEQPASVLPAQVNEPIWKRVMVHSFLPEKLQKLEEIANNLWWSWDDDAQELFETIDKDIWYNTEQNPFLLFEGVGYELLDELSRDEQYVEKLNKTYDRFKAYLGQPFRTDLPKIAYFSMEYGLHDCLKIYSGGLGILAGDYLKEASDSRVDLFGVGFLYRYGYFKQILSVHGEQMVTYDYQHFSKLPIKPVRSENGDHLTVNIAFPGRTVFVRIWEVSIGRIKLYLLDTDFGANRDEDRNITHHLYGGDNENRLKQEIVLGVGGIRAIEELGLNPLLYHSNEGHSAFISLERLRKYISNNNLSYAEAREIVRSSTLFTTHTPVPAGHDEFEEHVIRKYMAHYPERLNLNWQEFMSLGRVNPNYYNDKFNMSHLACHLAQEVNGVSLLHGQVSREMFAKLWPGYLPDEIHIGHVTNGVHYPTWTAKEWKAIYTEYFGENFLTDKCDSSCWEKIYNVPDKLIWDTKHALRTKLIKVIKDRLKDNWVKRHEDPKQIFAINHTLNDNTLTIGFARRFATYKRAHLLFRNIEKLAEIVNHPERPIQFLFAGKAHPQDKAGQDLIKYIVDISKRPEFLGKILFLQNYDMQLAKHLVRGVDIWLNTPTRPLEASGTSGEKAVMNGTMHFSVLDGWWVEGYQPDAGWALTNERTYADQGFQDDLDAETIYSILENEVAPAYYNRNGNDYSEEWVGYIKNTIAHVAPKFTMTRMINDYVDRYYGKLQKRSENMIADDCKTAMKLASWKRHLARYWNDIQVVDMDMPSDQSLQMGKPYTASVVVDLGNIAAKYIGLEIIITENTTKLVKIVPFELQSIEDGKAYYKAELSINTPGSFTYGTRLFPVNEMLAHRQDIGFLKWI